MAVTEKEASSGSVPRTNVRRFGSITTVATSPQRAHSDPAASDVTEVSPVAWRWATSSQELLELRLKLFPAGGEVLR